MELIQESKQLKLSIMTTKGWKTFDNKCQRLLAKKKLQQVLAYAKILNNVTTYARIAFFLDQHREMLGLTEKNLLPFDAFKPKSPHYLDRRNQEPNQLIARWNLIVPKSILQRIWEEPHDTTYS